MFVTSVLPIDPEFPDDEPGPHPLGRVVLIKQPVDDIFAPDAQQGIYTYRTDNLGLEDPYEV